MSDKDYAKHYADWFKARKEARRPAVTEISKEQTPWVGGVEGFLEKEAPKWLNSAYMKNVLQANKWRDKTSKRPKDASEFKPIEGPVFIRDKSPDWLKDIFGGGPWEEKISVSRKVARDFGTYRKTMWKIDKEVVLKNCDGADKLETKDEAKPKKGGKKSKKEDDDE